MRAAGVRALRWLKLPSIPEPLACLEQGEKMKTALTIAGSDSSGGAGIQADIKTMSALGVYAESVVTALTAQNTMGVQGVVATDPDFVLLQMESVFSDICPNAVKIGMLPTAEVVRAVGQGLQRFDAQNVVLDPVMVATSGAALSEAPAVQALFDLLVRASVVTPNIPEAEVLSDMRIETKEDMLAAAKAIQLKGAQAVLVKGGHLAEEADDVLLEANGAVTWLSAQRVETKNTHGTGCTLSSAIASYLAKGETLKHAVAFAKRYLTEAIQSNPGLGKGNGPVNHLFALR
jgi:hydroxymethylpyrimidine/phosphomethylpyrimidine kinase